MYKAGLVLEGGGMRGLYTAGILDFFLEKGITFENCYGVSAGACHLASYMAGQIGRAYRVSTNYLNDKNYCSFYSLIKTGDLFGEEMCYHKIPEELDKFDYEGFSRYPGKGYAVVTDVKTGKPVYLQLKDLDKNIDYIRASASLPLVSRNVKIGDREYLDGGAADSIPIRKAIKDGNEKNVIILTRPQGYKKKPASASNVALMKAKYKDSPGIVKAMANRHILYNKCLRYVEKLELEGKAFVFRPESIIKIDRIEKDVKKLKVLYLQGYHDASINYELMKKFLEK